MIGDTMKNLSALCFLFSISSMICMDAEKKVADEQQPQNHQQDANTTEKQAKAPETSSSNNNGEMHHQQAYRPDLTYRFDNGMTIEEAYNAGYEIRWWSLGAAMGASRKY